MSLEKLWREKSHWRIRSAAGHLLPITFGATGDIKLLSRTRWRIWRETTSASRLMWICSKVSSGGFPQQPLSFHSRFKTNGEKNETRQDHTTEIRRGDYRSRCRRDDRAASRARRNRIRCAERQTQHRSYRLRRPGGVRRDRASGRR